MAEELLLDLMYSVRIPKMWMSKFKKSYAFAVYRMIVGSALRRCVQGRQCVGDSVWFCTAFVGVRKPSGLNSCSNSCVVN